MWKIYFILNNLLNKKNLDKEDDPFWDPPESHLIGVKIYDFSYLDYLYDKSLDFQIEGEKL